MTVAELIARLREMPQDARVIVDGHGAAYVDAEAISRFPIKPDARGRGLHALDWGMPAAEIAVRIGPP